MQSGDDDDADFQVYQIRTAHLQHPIFRMLIHDTRLLDMVEGLLGSDLRLIHYQGLYKPARTGGEVRWHQDNHYFNVAENRTISVWLALDDATAENGCHVVPARPAPGGNAATSSFGTRRRKRVSISPSATSTIAAPFRPKSRRAVSPSTIA